MTLAPESHLRAADFEQVRAQFAEVTLSGELIGRGIRVNAVSPGPTATPMHEKLGLVGAPLDALVAPIPAGRRDHPDEIAQAIVFLASDEAAFTVGSEFVVDGAMSHL